MRCRADMSAPASASGSDALLGVAVAQMRFAAFAAVASTVASERRRQFAPAAAEFAALGAPRRKKNKERKSLSKVYTRKNQLKTGSNEGPRLHYRLLTLCPGAN